MDRRIEENREKAIQIAVKWNKVKMNQEKFQTLRSVLKDEFQVFDEEIETLEKNINEKWEKRQEKPKN